VGNSPLSGIDPLGLCGDDAPDADVQAEIEHIRGGYSAFWGGVRQVGNALNGGIEFAAAFNPVTSVGIGINKLGEGNYGQAALFALPVVGAFGGEGGAAAELSTFYHGTDVGSARSLLAGADLDASIAGTLNQGGDVGFYLAHDPDAAWFFAARRPPELGKYTILRYDITSDALAQLKAAGAESRPIPFGGRGQGFDLGHELYVPPSGFDLFNQLRAGGHIQVGAG
jgi:hypothetical protein